MHEHQGRAAVLQYAISDAAKRHTLETRPSVRCHQHERCMRLLRRTDDGGRRVTTLNLTTDRDTRVRPHASGKPVEVVPNRTDRVVLLLTNGSGDVFLGAQNVVCLLVDPDQKDLRAQIISAKAASWQAITTGAATMSGPR